MERPNNNARIIAVVVVVGVLSLALGIIIGWASTRSKHPEKDEAYQAWTDALKEADDGVTDLIIKELKADNIRDNLEYLTSRPHLGGTVEEKENAEYIKAKWDEQGLDSSRIIRYNILLSYPRKDQPNHAYILAENGTEVFRTAAEEAPLEHGDKHPDTVPPFNAYAKAGIVEGDLVYVNYGRVEDFQKLERELKINVTGKIAIARYGKIFRGDKANQAFYHGAIGLILYSDPADYAIDDVDRVYPDTWFLPGTGIQRGNVITRKGDPLTQGYPATDYMYQNDEDEVILPKIPVQPIGYDDAKRFLMLLDGNDVPDGWAGEIPGITYKVGPGLTNGRKVKLEVNNYNEVRSVYNVVGIIKGSLEPDRYVILGNHRDAWVFGAVDPSSGTAAMLELSRTFGKLVKNGQWRPRRSILFISWGAEEYGLMGSYEWVEEFGKTITERTVAYVNCDLAITGNYTFRGRSTPNFFNLLYDVTKKIPDAPQYGGSVYDNWLQKHPVSDGTVPYISDLGSGSDFRPFLGLVGIPSIDIRYDMDRSLGLSSYPLYHTMYETFHLVSAIMDPTFEYHLVIARVWGEIGRMLADSLILPIDCESYAVRMKDSIDYMKTIYGDQMAARPTPITFDSIDENLEKFATAAKNLHSRIETMDKTNPFAVRSVNDQLLFMERAFIDPLGLPGRPHER